MTNQRLRNLTTGRLHTQVSDIYEDVEFLTGEKGVMTHNLPNAFKAMQPFLRGRIKDPRFWDGAWDITHVGETDIAPMTKDEKASFWLEFGKLPHPFEALAKETK